jgi:hypothetical protein
LESVRQNSIPTKKHVMSNSIIIAFKKPGNISEDPLTELLRTGARQLIANAVENELLECLQQVTALKNEKGHQQIVRNGYLPEREFQTVIGPQPQAPSDHPVNNKARCPHHRNCSP